MLGNDYAGQDCSIARTLEVIGERWTLLIVRDAFYGVRRFKDFRDHLDIPRAVLADRLEGLVRDGVLARSPDPQHAGRHLYELTPDGRELWPVLRAMLAWGGQHRRSNSRLYTHADCGTRLGADGWCATCQTTPPPEDIIMVRRRGRGTSRSDPVTVALRGPHRLLEPLDT